MPALPHDFTLETLRKWAIEAHPEFAFMPMTLLSNGWDSVTLDVGDRFILKFPRHALGEAGLRKEAAILQIVRPELTLATAALELFEAPVLHSRHNKIPGVSLDPALYATLGESTRAAIGDALGLFFAQLHHVDDSRLRDLGIGPADAWLDAADIEKHAMPLLPQALHRWAGHALSAWSDLRPDPYGENFGHFDAHGWNMALDPATQHLSGILDFGDAGFGPVHREFVYPTLIGPDLMDRIIAAYSHHCGRHIDRDRVLILADIHRLWELAIERDDPESVKALLAETETWVANRP